MGHEVSNYLNAIVDELRANYLSTPSEPWDTKRVVPSDVANRQTLRLDVSCSGVRPSVDDMINPRGHTEWWEVDVNIVIRFEYDTEALRSHDPAMDVAVALAAWGNKRYFPTTEKYGFGSTALYFESAEPYELSDAFGQSDLYQAGAWIVKFTGGVKPDQTITHVGNVQAPDALAETGEGDVPPDFSAGYVLLNFRRLFINGVLIFDHREVE